MGMSAEERRKDANLIPPDEHLRLRVSKEASYISYRETELAMNVYVCEREKTCENVQPEKVMPAIPLDRTILIPTAMCSHVPMLSPVHMAAYLWAPAQNERVRTNGR
jgi:hypothetical protein